MNPDLLPLLILATWARSTGTLADRLSLSGSPDVVLGVRQRSMALADDRDFWLWRHAVGAASDNGLGHSV